MPIHVSEIEVVRPPHLGGGPWRLQELNNITVIFGKNGSGKSQLLRALRDLDARSMKRLSWRSILQRVEGRRIVRLWYGVLGI